MYVHLYLRMLLDLVHEKSLNPPSLLGRCYKLQVDTRVLG